MQRKRHRSKFNYSLRQASSPRRRRLLFEPLEMRCVLAIDAALIQDISIGGDSGPTGFVQYGSQTYFSADDGLAGIELWRTDGTTASLFADLHPTSNSIPQLLTVANGKLFFTATTPTTNREVWATDGVAAPQVFDVRPGSLSSLPESLISFNGELYFVADNGTGRGIWHTNGTAAASLVPGTAGLNPSAMIVSGGKLYSHGATGLLTCFDAAKGKQLWQADVGDKINGWGSAASPILYGELVIVNASVESDSLYAFDKKTGKEKWKAKGIREAWNTPVVVKTKDGKDELIVPIPGKVLAFDPTTGAQLWSCNTDIGWYMVPSVVAHDGIVYAIGGRSGVAALAVRTGGTGDVTKTHRLWTGKKGSNVSSPVFYDKHVYFMNDNNEHAFCLEAATGNVVYEERVGRAGTVYASSLLADGKIYYVARDGKTFVVAAKPEYELLATNDLRDGSLFHATPVAADGRLFIRSDKYLYCLEKK